MDQTLGIGSSKCFRTTNIQMSQSQLGNMHEYAVCMCMGIYIYIIHNQHRSEMLSSVKFHEVLGFWDFYGILGFKVKMHHFERPASRRVVRKSVECCGFC